MWSRSTLPRDQDNLTWDLVGPGEWVDARQVARVDPVTTPPEGVTGGRWIEVNLFEQTVSVYDNNRLIFATMVSTGVDRFLDTSRSVPDHRRNWIRKP